jgi:hypothetical protein
MQYSRESLTRAFYLKMHRRNTQFRKHSYSLGELGASYQRSTLNSSSPKRIYFDSARSFSSGSKEARLLVTKGILNDITLVLCGSKNYCF